MSANPGVDLKPVILLGDSHAVYLKLALSQKPLAPCKVDDCIVGGGTAVGMRNPNVMIDAVQTFREFVSDKDRNAIVVLQLGEADCGLIFWRRESRFGESVETQLEEGFKRILITGATLPTITDEDQTNRAVVQRADIGATQRQRTDITLHYNERLKAEAERRHLPYTDIALEVIEPETGLARRKFRHTNAADAHMQAEPAVSAWARALEAGFSTFDQVGAGEAATADAVVEKTTVVQDVAPAPILAQIAPEAPVGAAVKAEPAPATSSKADVRRSRAHFLQKKLRDFATRLSNEF